MERIPVKLYRVPIGHVCNYTHVVARTDLTLFLESSREYYTLAIWSSAKKKTVKSLTRTLFPEKILRELLFVWGQDKCECVDVKNLHGKGSEYDDDPSTSVNDSDCPVPKAAYKGIIFMKRLSKVWHVYPMWNKSNTLLLDDSPEKCQKFMENCLHPPPILGLDTDVIKIMMKNPTNSSNGGDEQRDNDELKVFNELNTDTDGIPSNYMRIVSENFQTVCKTWAISPKGFLCMCGVAKQFVRLIILSRVSILFAPLCLPFFMK